MKIMIKGMLCFALTVALMVISLVNAGAQNQFEKSLLYAYADDPFVADSIKEMEQNAVELSSDNYYMRQTTVNNKTVVDQKIYNAKDYQKAMSFKAGKNESVQNDWMKLTLEAIEKKDGSYTFILHYEWLTPPDLRYTDVIALGCSSNFSFDTTSIRSYHQHTGWNNQSSSFSYTYENDYQSNLEIVADAAVAKFKLDTDELYGMDTYSGYIQVDGRFTNIATKVGKLSFLYGHQQIGVDYSLSSSISYDEFGELEFTPQSTLFSDEYKYNAEFTR